MNCFYKLSLHPGLIHTFIQIQQHSVSPEPAVTQVFVKTQARNICTQVMWIICLSYRASFLETSQQLIQSHQTLDHSQHAGQFVAAFLLIRLSLLDQASQNVQTLTFNLK